MTQRSHRARTAYVLASWTGQVASVVSGVLVPSLLTPSAYALLFQLRQIHTFGFFAFAFILQGAVLELSFARGRADPLREAAIQRVSLLSILGLSGGCALLGAGVALVPRLSLTPEARWGTIAFCAILPAVGVSGWCNRVLLTVKRFDLLWRLVLVQMVGIACASFVGAYAFGFAGVVAGVAFGYGGAAAYGLWRCRGIDALGLQRDWRLMQELAAVGLPQTVMVLVLLATRTLDRNFAYLGYGEDMGGVFAVAAMFSMNLIYLTQVLAETARPNINEECGARGREAAGCALRGLPEAIFALGLGVAGSAYFLLPVLYKLLFPAYVQILPAAPELAVWALFAICPTALAFGPQMYLVATKRPLVYFVGPVLALCAMVGGNGVGLARGWGLFGIVAVGGVSSSIWAGATLGMAAWQYPNLRARCVRIALTAVSQVAVTAGLIVLLSGVGRWLVDFLAVSPAWRAVPGGALFVCASLLVMLRWSQGQHHEVRDVA